MATIRNSIALLLTVMLFGVACGGADTFPCGTNGGTCQTADELCLLNQGCSTCVALPVACETNLACGCTTDAEMATWDTPCTNLASCEDNEVGMILNCPSADWGCG